MEKGDKLRITFPRNSKFFEKFLCATLSDVFTPPPFDFAVPFQHQAKCKPTSDHILHPIRMGNKAYPIKKDLENQVQTEEELQIYREWEE